MPLFYEPQAFDKNLVNSIITKIGSAGEPAILFCIQYHASDNRKLFHMTDPPLYTAQELLGAKSSVLDELFTNSDAILCLRFPKKIIAPLIMLDMDLLSDDPHKIHPLEEPFLKTLAGLLVNSTGNVFDLPYELMSKPIKKKTKASRDP